MKKIKKNNKDKDVIINNGEVIIRDSTAHHSLNKLYKDNQQMGIRRDALNKRFQRGVKSGKYILGEHYFVYKDAKGSPNMIRCDVAEELVIGNQRVQQNLPTNATQIKLHRINTILREKEWKYQIEITPRDAPNVDIEDFKRNIIKMLESFKKNYYGEYVYVIEHKDSAGDYFPHAHIRCNTTITTRQKCDVLIDTYLRKCKIKRLSTKELGIQRDVRVVKYDPMDPKNPRYEDPDWDYMLKQYKNENNQDTINYYGVVEHSAK